MKFRNTLIALAISAALPGVALAATSEDSGANGDKRMKDRFDRLDQDGNGRVDRDEFKAGGKFLFGKMDVNGDGVITLAELEEHERAERIAKRFEHMDGDGDGKVTTNEFAQAGAKLFQRLDENEDGYLSKGELEKRRHGGGKGGPDGGPEGQN